MSRPGLSLCVVARDEAALLGDAIASAQPVVDEVVVVDTGSTDETAEIAARAGARVVHARWPGDLARAHDLPVAHARGDWVLVLDADEVLDPHRRDRLRDLIRTGSHDGYALPVRNYTYGWWDRRWRPADPRDPVARGAAGYVPTAPIRLFRGDPAHRFAGALHQTVVPAIRANGGRIGHGDVPIHHYGFLRFDRDKSSLYPRLARQQVAARPDDPHAWIDLGILLEEAGRLPDAADAFRRAHDLGEHGDAAFLLGSALLAMGHARDAIPLLHQALRAPETATHHFDRADAWDAVGQAREQVDELEIAEAAYRRAARAGKPSGTANLAALLIDTHRADEADALLDEALARHPGIDVFWSLRGTARLKADDPQAACAALETALDIRPENAAARVNLGVAHKRAGRPRQAAEAFAGASEALDTEEGRRLGLARRLGRHRAARAVSLPRGPGLVLSVIPALAGGGGRVLVDAVRALADADRPQLVACASTYDHSGQGLRAELGDLGVDTVTVSDEGGLHRLLAQLHPSVVLHHWWRGSPIAGPVRVTEARWICIGHAPLPMPRGYDAWVANSAYHRSLQGHLPAASVVDLPNGVDLERFQPAGRQPDEPVTIAMLSRLDPGKFPRALLSYLPALDGARVLVAGFGARRHELTADVARRGLSDRVRFLGPVASPRVPQLLATADIGLHLTELHRELCSMSVLEMLASGLPVVAEPKGGLPEMVAHGVNGFLADEPAAVAAHLRRLVDDPDLRARMGAASRQVARRYDLAAYRTAMRELVADVERRDRRQHRFRAASPHDEAPASPATQPSAAYLVCATPRSGSNLLCEALGNTGLAGHPQEFFSPVFEATLPDRWGCDSVTAYLAALVERTATPNGVFGAKIMALHLPRLVSDLQALPAFAGLDAPALLTTVLPGLRYVWIRRRDRLRQAISWVRARQTGAWIREGPGDAQPPATPRFDRREIQDCMDRLEAAEARWSEFFATAGIEPIDVGYEELVADYEGTARRVLAELGITVPTALRFGPRRLSRQADELTEQWARRVRSGDELDGGRVRIPGHLDGPARAAVSPAGTVED